MNLSIRPLLLGEAIVPNILDVFWSLSMDPGHSSVPILAFLILGSPEGPIVVDCGMRDPARAVDIHRLGPHTVAADQTMVAQLANYGIKLEDVRLLILTHLHYDHAGGCSLFPNARIVVQRKELMAAAAPMGPSDLPVGGKGLFYDRADIAELVDPLWDRVFLLEGDETIAPGIDCVLYENTHTPGHQCVYVRTAEGTVSIVGDIARKIDLNIKQVTPPGLYYDLESTRRALIDIAKRSDLILPTHDWETMKYGLIA